MFKKIYLEIGNMCNLHCHFCSIDNRKKEIMSVENFKKLIPQIKEYTDYLYLHVKGEPLLHPDLEEVLSICSLYNMKVNLTTNGTKLGEKLEVIMKSTCIRQVNISAHSLSEIAYFEKNNYLDNLLKIVLFAHKTKNFFVSIRLWIENEEINNLVLNFLNNNLLLDKPIAINSSKIIDNVYLSKDEEFVWPNLKNEFVSEKGRCYGTRDQIAILVNGDVVPCCLDSSGVMVLGNCFSKPLKEILSSGRFIEIQDGFKKGIVKEELCKHCSYRLRFK